jgi:hypothetical protein
MYREIAKERYPFTGWFWKEKKEGTISRPGMIAIRPVKPEGIG